MSSEKHTGHELHPNGGFWTSRSGMALAIFLVVGVLFLIYEHRIHLLAGNTLIVALLAVCVGVHFFLHRHTDGTDEHKDRQ